MPATDKVILVVEDHDFQRRTLVRMLRNLNAYEVLEAANGKEALAQLAESTPRRPDIALCDLDMPEMDGMEFIRHLGEAKSGLSVLITSSLDSALLASVEKMCRAYGVRLLGVIEKPVSLARLEELLARHRNLDIAPQRPPQDLPVFSIDEILQSVENREFEPVFQPKVALATGQVVGAEALVRWRHPRHGIVYPSAFVPMLEQRRQIDALTFLMLERSAHACQSWLKRGCDVDVSVNLSLVSLADPTLADRILETVRAAGLDPRRMILEITETAAMTEVAPALENLTRLRMRGFGLSIDDYGTGFSSMQQLTRVPFTELKIDQSFVAGCTTNPAARVIIESSLAVARGLSLNSVAEGVETQADWEALKEMGCAIAQGYLIAKPMDESNFRDFCGERTSA